MSGAGGKRAEGRRALALARHRSAARWRPRALVLAATVFLAAAGQDPRSEERMPTVRDLSSADDRQRILAADHLVRNWPTEMKQVLAEIATFRSDIDYLARSGNHQRMTYFLALTHVVRSMLKGAGDKAIARFRDSDDRAVIETLVRAARSADRGIRVNATIILANVSDNSTVCVAVDELRDPRLDANGRINLLQVVRTVAGQMTGENAEATRRSLAILRERLGGARARDNERSLDLMDNIEDRLARSRRSTAPASDRRQACAGYRYRWG